MWLGEQDALRVVDNRLTSGLAPFAQVIAALEGERSWPRGWRIETPGGGRQVVITAQLIGDDGARDLPFAPVIVLTLLSDEDVPREQLDGLAAAFGWTSREREIVRLLASGAQLHQLADTLRISPQTVTVHIRNANAKAGFRRQIDLMRLVQRA